MNDDPTREAMRSALEAILTSPAGDLPDPSQACWTLPRRPLPPSQADQ